MRFGPKGTRASWALQLAVCAAASAVMGLAAVAMKNPLYGDPKHPNISGMWNPEFAYFGPPIPAAGAGAGAPVGGFPKGGFPPRPPDPQLTPAYAAKYAVWRKAYAEGKQEPDTVTRCLAFGIARFGTMPMEIIQTPGQVTMNLGVLHDIRRIFLDGIGHTVGADPSFNGDSVGRWQGDTLVVETNNIRAATIDRDGVPYSDQLTVVERIRRTAPARLEIETTLTDPEAFLVPYTIRRAYVPMPPGSRFEEYLCENNRDL
ncbi:MAG TPA: hypothetical protein VIY90_13760 [Steroidobacteraceae bacterium]